MASERYYVRIELHDGDEKYDELHKDLKAKGFYRYFFVGDGKDRVYYHLPWGLYRTDASSLSDIRNKIVKTFEKLKVKGEFVSVKRADDGFGYYGLSQISKEEADEL